MTMEMAQHPRPSSHLLLAAASIGALSTLLAAGLGGFGILESLNQWIASALSQGHSGQFPQAIPGWLVHALTAISAFALPLSVLAVPGTWRRSLLAITAVVLVAGWAPVLSLAAYSPDIAAPFIATLWSGICALFYASNHRMACDEPPPESPHETHRLPPTR